jgi:hypothetical protein
MRRASVLLFVLVSAVTPAVYGQQAAAAWTSDQAKGKYSFGYRYYQWENYSYFTRISMAGHICQEMLLLAVDLSSLYGLDPAFVLAVLYTENNTLNPIARNRFGTGPDEYAYGLWQLNMRYADYFSRSFADGMDITNPRVATLAAVRYIYVLYRNSASNYTNTAKAYFSGLHGDYNSKAVIKYAKDVMNVYYYFDRLGAVHLTDLMYESNPYREGNGVYTIYLRHPYNVVLNKDGGYGPERASEETEE